MLRPGTPCTLALWVRYLAACGPVNSPGWPGASAQTYFCTSVGSVLIRLCDDRDHVQAGDAQLGDLLGVGQRVSALGDQLGRRPGLDVGRRQRAGQVGGRGRGVLAGERHDLDRRGQVLQAEPALELVVLGRPDQDAHGLAGQLAGEVIDFGTISASASKLCAITTSTPVLVPMAPTTGGLPTPLMACRLPLRISAIAVTPGVERHEVQVGRNGLGQRRVAGDDAVRVGHGALPVGDREARAAPPRAAAALGDGPDDRARSTAPPRPRPTLRVDAPPPSACRPVRRLRAGVAVSGGGAHAALRVVGGGVALERHARRGRRRRPGPARPR